MMVCTKLKKSVHISLGKHITGCVEKNGDPDFPQLAKMYVFGEKIQDMSFQDAVLEELINGIDREDCNFLPGSAAVRVVYEGTAVDAPARDLIVQAHVKHGVEPCPKAADWNVDFLLNLVRALRRGKKRDSVGELWPMRDRWLKGRYLRGTFAIFIVSYWPGLELDDAV